MFVASLAALAGCLLVWPAGEARQTDAMAKVDVDWDSVLRRTSGAQPQGLAAVTNEVAGSGQTYSRVGGSFSNGALASLDDGTVRIEIVHTLSSEAVRDVVADAGGEVYGEVPGMLAEARVPAPGVHEIEDAPGVTSVRPPIQQAIPLSSGPLPGDFSAFEDSVALAGQEIVKTNADEWHDAGITGEGVKVGIIDFFDGQLWADGESGGELPPPSGAFCRIFGEPCDLWEAGEPHGVAVGEIIHEMAPDAELFVATVFTTSDTQAAVDYFASQGVDVISRSLTSEYDGPGDGTGPLASVIDNAVADGMLWVNAAGNAAGLINERDGSHWRGTWSDPDHDGFLNIV